MSFIQRCVQAFQSFDNRFLWIGPRVPVGARASEALARRPIIVADVGSTGGSDTRWHPLRAFVRFLTFDPRPNPAQANPAVTNFPKALGAAPGPATLHLTEYAESSGIYPIDAARMNDFAVRGCFRIVQTEPLELDTLDRVLAGRPETAPDFIKVDVEGADLDVLRGGVENLRQSVLGARVEIAFMSRHTGAPEFCAADHFLREQGFILFTLSRELMLRHNQTHSPLSQPQAVWGDGTYFLRRDVFLKRLSALKLSERDPLLARFVLILLAHAVHDYAIEILDAAAEGKLAEAALIEELRESVLASARGTARYIFQAAIGAALATAIYIPALLVPPARLHATYYFKRRWGHLLWLLWRCAARGGALNATISE